MLYIIGIIVVLLLLFFVAIPLLKHLFGLLVAFLGNLLGMIIGIGLIILTIALCIAFPPLIVVFGGIILFYKYSK